MLCGRVRCFANPTSALWHTRHETRTWQVPLCQSKTSMAGARCCARVTAAAMAHATAPAASRANSSHSSHAGNARRQPPLPARMVLCDTGCSTRGVVLPDWLSSDCSCRLDSAPCRQTRCCSFSTFGGLGKSSKPNGTNANRVPQAGRHSQFAKHFT